MIEKFGKLALLRPRAGRIAARRPEEVAPSALTPRAAFFDIVDELARRDRLSFPDAMARAKDERPDAFIAAFPVARRPRGSTALDDRGAGLDRLERVAA